MARSKFFALSLLLATFCLASRGQEASDPPEDWPTAICDNSFLIEEAYNQEPGVIQHIFTGWQITPGGAWVESFTQEWPVPKETHQLSYTLAYTSEGGEGEEGFGDAMLNYRYQASMDGPGKAAFAPRLSVILPTGSTRKALGLGTVGWQFNLPVSKRVSEHFTLHFNVGSTFFPGAESYSEGSHKVRRDLWGYNLGGSVIALLTQRFNLMLEVVGYRNDIITEAGAKRYVNLAYANPGLRYAFNLEWGQVVCGLSVPLGLTGDTPNNGLFLYVSIEHPLWTPKR